jgi:DNA helicase-2/ATP-dependent DNA helicase PcrA
MPTSSTFDQVYKTLNPEQKQAVDTIDGPVMVIAGPGTGKTQVLAARIANILLKTDTNPSSILALTFTESAAKNMRQRLVSMIGKTGYYVQIHTFHSFCTDVINSHPEFFPIDRESQPLAELERFDILQKIIDELELEVLKPLNMPYFYLRDIVKTISDLKREGINVTEFEKIVAAEQSLFDQEQEALTKTERTRRQKMIAKNTELVHVYTQYQRRLRDSLRYDFDDMIALVVEAFATQEELLLDYQERLLYFLIDEYQDTNSAQNQVVDLLAAHWEEAANVFVVGDPNQAIYRFQGASLENVLNFTHRYPTTAVITLTTGYRSPQTIYDAAADLIKENNAEVSSQFGLSTRLKSTKPGGTSIGLFNSPSSTLETVFVAESIKKLIDQGVKPEAIAVLYRNNSDSLEMSLALDKWNIRYEIDGGNNVLDAEHICQLLNLFKVIEAVRTGAEDGLLFEVMQYDWIDLDSLVIMQASRAASKAKKTLIELIQSGYEVFSQHAVGTVTAIEFAPLEEFIKKLLTWGGREAQIAFPAWFELVITDSGYLPWLQDQPTKIEMLNELNSLFREVRSLAAGRRDFGLTAFLEVLATFEEHHLTITVEDLNITENAVRLSTVHKAKGQEWSHVFLIKCVDGKWGNSAKRELIPLPPGILKHTDISKKERNEDERRLFYVAMTRAQSALTISYPETIITDNRSKSVVPSLFIEEIRPHVQAIKNEVTQDVINRADEHLVALLSPTKPRPRAAAETAFFQELVKDFKLSITALNTYLRSPQDFITQSLLKVPTAKPVHLAFGTAIHVALEEWYKRLQASGEHPSLETVLHHFEEALTLEALRTEEFNKRLTYGQKVLTTYYAEKSQVTTQPLFIERFFGFGWSRTIIDDIQLTGRVDRVDWISQADRTVCVIDYKTGKPRTSGEIEGKTLSAELSEREQSLPESIRGPYKRQLLFYKLLSQLDRSFVPTVTEGTFDFVEPDKQSGKLITRTFPLPDEEVEDLKKLIREVMAEIRSLAFLEM